MYLEEYLDSAALIKISPYINTSIASLVIRTYGECDAKKPPKFSLKQRTKTLRSFMHEDPLALKKKGDHKRRKEIKNYRHSYYWLPPDFQQHLVAW